MFLDTSNLRTDEILLKLEKTVDANPITGWLPAYHFKICLLDGTDVGHCDFRVGEIYLGGNVGYGVNELYRGNHYAGKACLLLLELARKHGMKSIYITCNPDNFASRKTCEYAGGILEAIVDLPEDNDMYLEGDRQKCVYKFNLQ